MQQLLEAACDRERVALIFNPASGTEAAEVRRARLEELIRAARLACSPAETEAASGAAPLARQAVEDGMERLLVCGGDGSVMEAAAELAGTPTALAVLPGGTGNLLALNLGIPVDPAAAARVALTEEARPLDVGRANGKAFLIMAGIGADAEMIHDARREIKRRFGWLAYFLAAARHLGHPRHLYTVRVDGRTFRRHAHTVLVANVGRITGGLELIPGADPADGLLEVGILRARTPLDLLTLVGRTLLGRPPTTDLLEVHRGRRIVIEADQPLPVQLDGNEAGEALRLDVEVQPGSLRLVRPARPETPLSAATAAVASAHEWVPLTVGAAAALVLSARKQALEQRGERPGPLARHPLLTGLVVAGALGLLLASRALRASRAGTEAPLE